MTNTDFIGELKKRRYDLGLSLSDLSEKVGYHPNTIWHWESRRKNPSFKSLIDWSEALGAKIRLEWDNV